MNSESFLTVAERFGIWAAFCIALVMAILFFAWRREARMAARIDRLESEMHQSALAVARALELNGETLKRNLTLQEEILKELRALNVEMRVRPCLRHTREMKA